MAKTEDKATPSDNLPATQPDNLPLMIEPTAELVQQAYDAILKRKLPPEIGDPTITARAIQERIRNSNDFDKVFSPQSLTPWQQYMGEAVTVLGFHLNPSTFENNPSAVYAAVEIARDPDFEVETVGCGGGNVLVQLVKAWEQSWFPLRLRLIAKGTSSGFETLYLERAE